MDRRVIFEKVESLRRCVRRIEEKRPDDPEVLMEDWDLQDILSLNLMRAVQLCVDVAAHVIASLDAPPPDTMAGAFDVLRDAGWLDPDLTDRMKAAVGFRNVAVHTYRAIDWMIVYRICHEHLGEFRAFAHSVTEIVEKLEE